VLTDLTADDLADYLPRTTRREGTAGTVWEPVLTRVREEPDGDLAAVLTTPLMVSLARMIYSDTPDHDPAELLTRFDTREAIERHLLASFVPTVYRHPPDHGHDIDRVEHWLGWLAHHLDRLGRADLAWWQLGDRMRVWQRMLVSGLVLGVATGFPAVLVFGLFVALGVGTSGGGLAHGLSEGLAAGPLEGLTAGMTVGLAHGASLLIGNTAFEPSRVRFQLRLARASRIPRRFLSGLAVGVGLGAGLGIARELGATFRIVGRIGDTPLAGVLFGLTFGVVLGLVWAVTANFERPVDISSAASPLDLLDINRRTVLIQSMIFGAVTWLVYAVAVGVVHGPRSGVVYGLSYGLVLGLATCLAVTSLTAWGTWMVFARVWLPLNGRLPLAPAEFLQDAYRRGVLRRAGAVYQFRHARLQDHLKQVYRSAR
jgi:hypothetical protein